MGNLNLSEIILLVVLAVIIFGPDKLPELARKLARLLKFLRGVANNAQDTVRRELGPEYADLELRDLTPKNLVRKALAEDYEVIESEIKGLRHDVAGVRGDVDALTTQTRAELSQLDQAAAESADGAADPASGPDTETGAAVPWATSTRWDLEAT